MKIVKINGVEYPVYATVCEADVYFNGAFGSDWENIDDDDKIRLLVSATRNIDRQEYRGSKVEPTQALEFPRIINNNETDDIILTNACCEEAYAIFNKGQSAVSDIDGIKRIEVQDTTIEFNDSADLSGYVSDVADDLLRPYRYLGVSVLY